MKAFSLFQDERGVADSYTLTAIQADAILRMTLGTIGQSGTGTAWRRTPQTA